MIDFEEMFNGKEKPIKANVAVVKDGVGIIVNLKTKETLGYINDYLVDVINQWHIYYKPTKCGARLFVANKDWSVRLPLSHFVWVVTRGCFPPKDMHVHHVYHVSVNLAEALELRSPHKKHPPLYHSIDAFLASDDYKNLKDRAFCTVDKF